MIDGYIELNRLSATSAMSGGRWLTNLAAKYITICSIQYSVNVPDIWRIACSKADPIFCT